IRLVIRPAEEQANVVMARIERADGEFGAVKILRRARGRSGSVRRADAERKQRAQGHDISPQDASSPVSHPLHHSIDALTPSGLRADQCMPPTLATWPDSRHSDRAYAKRQTPLARACVRAAERLTAPTLLGRGALPGDRNEFGLVCVSRCGRRV